jgi:ComF family protein
VFQRVSRAFFSLLFPDECRVCGKSLVEISRTPVCPACLAQPEPFEAEHWCRACRTPFRNAFPLGDEGLCGLCRAGVRGFDAAYCFGSYEGTLRTLIHLFKYHRMAPLDRPLSRMLERALPPDERIDAVVPAPLHWRRKWQRGFNQAELLARRIASRRGVPLIRGLRRTRATRPQAGLSNTARRENVTGAFQARRRLDGMSVLLVDDVMTTGSTATACAFALKRAGARRVVLLTVARVDRRFQAAVPAAGGKTRDGGASGNGE